MFEDGHHCRFCGYMSSEGERFQTFQMEPQYKIFRERQGYDAEDEYELCLFCARSSMRANTTIGYLKHPDDEVIVERVVGRYMNTLFDLILDL